jgi:hypothetical protein
LDGLGLLVMESGELSDGTFQSRNAAARGTLNLALCKPCEPTLDLIEPGSMGRGRVQMIARPLLQPVADQRSFMGAVVVQYQVDLHVGWNGASILFKKSRNSTER